MVLLVGMSKMLFKAIYFIGFNVSRQELDNVCFQIQFHDPIYFLYMRQGTRNVAKNDQDTKCSTAFSQTTKMSQMKLKTDFSTSNMYFVVIEVW